jgi:hypothetical protein
MKKLTVSMLALFALAGGAMIASAATTKTPDRGDEYVFDPIFTNPPTFVVADGLPTPSKTVLKALDDLIVFTDGSGKIDGVTSLVISNPTTSELTGIYVADISGSITTVKTNPSIKMTIKGNGYAEAGRLTNQQSSTVSLNFASTTTSGVTTNTPSFSMSTNTQVIFLNSDNTTNHTQTIGPAFAFSTTAYSNLTITYHFSQQVGTNTGGSGTTNIVDDQFYQITFPFGAAVATNIFGTNNELPLGYDVNTNFTYTLVAVAQQTSIFGTNLTPGLDIGSVAGVISHMTASNATVNQVVVSVKTSSVPANVTVGGFPLLFTNVTLSVPGTLNGSIKAGKETTQVKNEAASMVASAFWTGPNTFQSGQQLTLVSTNFEIVTNVVTNIVVGVSTNVVTNVVTHFPTFFSSGSGSGISLFTETGLFGEVVQLGKKMWLAIDDDFENFSGTGSQTTKNVGKGTNATGVTSYTANLKGIARSRGSSLTLKGTNNVLITAYNVVSNGPATVRSFTNMAVTPPLVVTVTNTTTNSVSIDTSTVFSVGGVTYTNTLGDGSSLVFVTTNAAAASSYLQTEITFDSIAIPPTIVTNTVPLGIKTILKTGKMIGQKLPTPSKTVQGVSGFLPDTEFPFDDGLVPNTP